MEQGHGFCRVGGGGWGAVVGKPGEKVAFEQSLLGGGGAQEWKETAPQGPRGSQACLWGRWGMGGRLASLILLCGIGLGWEVCVCLCVCISKNRRESWLCQSCGVASACACGFMPCPVCVRACAR